MHGVEEREEELSAAIMVWEDAPPQPDMEM